MDWTREGAHNVLQVRGLIVRQEQDEIWQNFVPLASGAMGKKANGRKNNSPDLSRSGGHNSCQISHRT